MNRKIIVSNDADTDMRKAVVWLHDRSPELPQRFSIEFENVLKSITDHPEMYPVVYRRFRRAPLRRFPYSVFYTVERDAILIVGVVHQARDESTWKRRG